jgi:hypothetical protein
MALSVKGGRSIILPFLLLLLEGRGFYFTTA